jgi:hypothetical protein
MGASDEAKKRRDPGDGEVMVDKTEANGDEVEREQMAEGVQSTENSWLLSRREGAA